MMVARNLLDAVSTDGRPDRPALHRATNQALDTERRVSCFLDTVLTGRRPVNAAVIRTSNGHRKNTDFDRS